MVKPMIDRALRRPSGRLMTLLALCAMGSPGMATAQRRVPIEGSRIIVDDTVVTEYDIRKRARDDKLDLTRDEVRAQIIRDLFHEARVLSIGGRAEVDSELVKKTAEESVMRQQQTAGGRRGLIDLLRAGGQTFDEYLANQRAEFRFERLRQTLLFDVGPEGRPGSDLYIRPRTIRRYYQRHKDQFEEQATIRGRRILIPWNRHESKAAARKAAEALLAEILAGKRTFEEAAREHSAWNQGGAGDLAGKESGEPGPIPLRASTTFPIELVRALREAETGIHPELIEKVQEGINLVQVLGRTERRIRPFSDPQVQREIEERLRRQRQDKLFNNYLERLAAEPFIWPPELRR